MDAGNLQGSQSISSFFNDCLFRVNLRGPNRSKTSRNHLKLWDSKLTFFSSILQARTFRAPSIAVRRRALSLAFPCLNRRISGFPYLVHLNLVGFPFWDLVFQAPPYLLPKLSAKMSCLSCLPELSGRLGPDLVCPHGLFQPRSLYAKGIPMEKRSVGQRIATFQDPSTSFLWIEAFGCFYDGMYGSNNQFKLVIAHSGNSPAACSFPKPQPITACIAWAVEFPTKQIHKPCKVRNETNLLDPLQCLYLSLAGAKSKQSAFTVVNVTPSAEDRAAWSFQ